jgi:hypothetical protein
MPIWIEPALKIVSLSATPIIAVCVAYISYRQWKTAQEKVRLDLYNRRFATYLAAVIFCRMIHPWENSDEQSEIYKTFTSARYEAGFLFPDKSGVPALFEEILQKAILIITKPRNIDIEATSDELADQMQRLTDRVGPYMNFHQL